MVTEDHNKCLILYDRLIQNVCFCIWVPYQISASVYLRSAQIYLVLYGKPTKSLIPYLGLYKNFASISESQWNICFHVRHLNRAGLFMYLQRYIQNIFCRVWVLYIIPSSVSDEHTEISFSASKHHTKRCVLHSRHIQNVCVFMWGLLGMYENRNSGGIVTLTIFSVADLSSLNSSLPGIEKAGCQGNVKTNSNPTWNSFPSKRRCWNVHCNPNTTLNVVTVTTMGNSSWSL